MNAKTLSRSAVAAAVAVALSAGYVAGHRDVPAPQVISPAQAAMMPAEAAAKTGIPDFSGLVETYGPAVVNISAKHVVKRTALRSNGGNGGMSGGNQLPIDPSDPVLSVLQALLWRHAGLQRRRRRRRARSAEREPRLRLHRQQRRLHPDQRARRRRRERRHREAHRQARVQGQGDRRRQAHRRRGAQDRREAICRP